MTYQVAVLGAGNMGTAVAQVLALQGHRVWLWDYSRETMEAIARTHANEQFLPGVKLSRRITAEASMERAVENAALVIVACASPYVRQTARHLGHCLGITPPTSPYLKGRGRSARPPLKIRGGRGVMNRPIIAHIAKGLESKTNLTMHEVVQSELPQTLRRSVVTISGPSIAKELVMGVPTAVVAASQDARAAQFVQGAFTSNTLKVAISRDWKGVSICGALKNVYAIALGMCDGMRLTFNAKAFMFTVAVQEMKKVIVSLGGKAATVDGLAGIGDLVVTGLGDGRNRALGERICKEGHCKFVWTKTAQTHEGVAATKVFYKLARRSKLSFVNSDKAKLFSVKTPLLYTVYRVLYRGADPCKAIQNFFVALKFL